MWGNPTLFHRIYWKNYLEKINIETISWEKLFDWFANHKQDYIPWLVNAKASVNSQYFCSRYLEWIRNIMKYYYACPKNIRQLEGFWFLRE